MPGKVNFVVLNLVKQSITSEGQAVLYYYIPTGAGWDEHLAMYFQCQGRGFYSIYT